MLKILFLFLGLLPYAAQARLLNDSEMREFVAEHKRELDEIKRDNNIHMAYCVVTFASLRMINNDFPSEDKQKVASYYGQVILSALSGIGFGGLSKDKVASAEEQCCAYLALCGIGINLPEPLNFQPDSGYDTMPDQHKDHYQTINRVLRLGFNIRSADSDAARVFAAMVDETLEKTKEIQKPVTGCTYEDFEPQGALYIQQKLLDISLNLQADEASPALFLSTSQYLEKLRAQNEAAEVRTETGMPWNGVLYRDRAAAEKAIERGLSEAIAKATGVLNIVLKCNKSYGSTATIFMSTLTGTIWAIANAQAVYSHEDNIRSVYMDFPDSERIYFNKLFLHPDYKDGIDDYELALLKGTCTKQRPYIPIYPRPITEALLNTDGVVVSIGAVNYIEGSRIHSLEGVHPVLSVKRVTHVQPNLPFRAQFPYLLASGESVDSLIHLGERICMYGVKFPPEKDGESHQLDAAFSFGALGSPFFVKRDEDYYLAGIFSVLRYNPKGGKIFRSNYVASIGTDRIWIEDVIAGLLEPNWSL